MTLNHRIWPEYDIDLAMIEGNEIEALCGDRFVPSVAVGTSGRAHVPGAPMCPTCEAVDDVWDAFTKLREQRDAIQLQMDDLNASYRILRTTRRVLEEIPA